MSEDSFPIDVVHQGVRFTLGDPKAIMRILFEKVWDHEVTVQQAMECLKVTPPSQSGSENGSRG